ncbi:Os01g0853600 [Oryza sativa Japonica Group]|uniref:Os01g0853600 protein n=1 Tax=Oryza sativa subsp. japonica TaxID=39947 RepID=C7IWM5_ORYSJ|nr:Os01g0853600 [Oryza sativa Japonica Group]|eukprot:NP_001172657.1 Os01g0853600 [Oryza sativa Japonica Group]
MTVAATDADQSVPGISGVDKVIRLHANLDPREETRPRLPAGPHPHIVAARSRAPATNAVARSRAQWSPLGLICPIVGGDRGSPARTTGPEAAPLYVILRPSGALLTYRPGDGEGVLTESRPPSRGLDSP